MSPSCRVTNWRIRPISAETESGSALRSCRVISHCGLRGVEFEPVVAGNGDEEAHGVESSVSVECASDHSSSTSHDSAQSSRISGRSRFT